MNLLLVPLTIGLPAIDESLDKLLVAMETFPNVAVLGDAIGLARILGLLLALAFSAVRFSVHGINRSDIHLFLRFFSLNA